MSRSRPSLQQMLDEPCASLLWPRAALMQLADPRMAPTEAESGAYANRGAQRRRGTIEYLRLAASADDAVAAALVREVNRVHAAIRVPRGREPAGRGRRPAFDPDLQLWVAVTWFVSLIDVYRLLVSDLDDDVVDELLADFARVGTLLQMPAERWPVDSAALRDYVRSVEATFPSSLPRTVGVEPDEDGVVGLPSPGDVAAQVFSTYSLPRRQVRAMPRVRLLSWGMAGPDLRAVYGVDWGDDVADRYDVAVRRLRRRYALVPGVLRRARGRRERHRSEREFRRSAGARELRAVS